MIEQVKCWGLLIQRYFLYVCHCISYHIKSYGSITSTRSPSRDSTTQVHEKSVDFLNPNGIKAHNLVEKQGKSKPSWCIPGPKSVPVFGTLFDFNKFGATRVHELAAARHAEYGDIFR